jgi:hypothetical protein
MILAMTIGFLLLAMAVTILLLRLNDQERRIVRLETMERDRKALPNLQAHSAASGSTLSTLHIVLAVQQDHSLSPFAERLSDQFRKHGAVVTRIAANDMANAPTDFEVAYPAADIIVSGNIVCNGYTDVCFKADLFAMCPFGELPPLVRQYADGAPQQSVAIEAAEYFAAAFAKTRDIHERERAVRELSGSYQNEEDRNSAHQQQHTR